MKDYCLLLLGALVQALAMRLFLVPGELVSGGISGTAQIVNHFVNFPIGVMVLVGNIPLVHPGLALSGRQAICGAHRGFRRGIFHFYRPVGLLYPSRRHDSGQFSERNLRRGLAGYRAWAGLPRQRDQRRFGYPGQDPQSPVWHLDFAWLT